MDKITQRRWHNMLVAAISDKTLGADEKKLLEEMRKELGMTADEANAIVADYKKNKGGIELSGTYEQKLDFFRDVLRMVLVDGVIDAGERKMVNAVAKHLKLDEQELNALIEECRKPAKEVAEDAAEESYHCTSPDAPATMSAKAKSKTEAAAPEATCEVSQPSGIELITIEKSVFMYGDMSVAGRSDKQKIDTFKIAKYPVTNEQWQKFETATGYKGRVDYGDRFNHPNQPVVGVNRDDALEFCKWAGLRLPTEVEWERAARGTDGRRYAWGNEYPDEAFANYGSSLFDLTRPRTVSVAAHPAGRSAEGCYDMTGNSEEWCAGQFTDGRIPIRGGNWLSAPYALNIYYHRMMEKDVRADTLGFRVAADA